MKYHTVSMVPGYRLGGHTFQLHARRHVCLREQTRRVSDPLWIAEPAPHLPAQLGDIIINFIINFLLYTSK